MRARRKQGSAELLSRRFSGFPKDLGEGTIAAPGLTPEKLLSMIGREQDRVEVRCAVPGAGHHEGSGPLDAELGDL
ncbi:hypothetical protein [Paracoccus fontiphilus]|uniref:Uncharacterized protein n=1 Tax=Paracoccus fontiphilus TaxID=1815556 RepID=A0ABV7IB88_9RHOB|nr:hypothetical protein [Paracoccus fontiphilus]